MCRARSIALVVAVQSTQEAWAALDKIKKIGSMIEPLVAGERGEAAVLWYDHDVTVAQDFTGDTTTLATVFEHAGARGSGGSAKTTARSFWSLARVRTAAAVHRWNESSRARNLLAVSNAIHRQTAGGLRPPRRPLQTAR